MAVLKKVTLFLLVFSFFCSTSVFADEASIRDEINQLKERIATLEKKVSEQDTYIATQNTTTQSQQQQIHEYEAKLSQFEEKLKRVPGEPMKLMEGLELGVGGTMIVQGTNNTNNATSDVTKERRTRGCFLFS